MGLVILVLQLMELVVEAVLELQEVMDLILQQEMVALVFQLQLIFLLQLMLVEVVVALILLQLQLELVVQEAEALEFHLIASLFLLFLE